MRYGSVCSGIEAASLAWEPLGWQAAWFAEIEKFPSQVLAHRWPTVPNLGDMCQLPGLIRSGQVEAPDILVGGTPCQAYSVAGKREGLSDSRGQLTLTYVEVADAIDSQRPDSPCIVVWENVPGVLSSKDNAFGCFLGDLVGEDCPLEPPGGKWSNAGCVYGPTRTAAWRVIDAQYFGVAQRRRRVFVVASAREGFNPTEVLFEREGLRRDTAPSRETWQETPCFTPSSINAYRQGVGSLRANGGDNGGGSENLVVSTLPIGLDEEQNATIDFFGTLKARTAGGGFEGSVLCMSTGQAGAEIGIGIGTTLNCNHEAPIVVQSQYGDLAGSLTARHDSSPCADRGMNVVAVGFQSSQSGVRLVDTHATLDSNNGSRRHNGVVCFDTTQVTSTQNYSNPKLNDPCHPLAAAMHPPVAVLLPQMSVRRLTPRECERLQGFTESRKTVSVRVCHYSDHQKTSVLAETQCHRLQNSVQPVGNSELLPSVLSVTQNFNTDQVNQNPPVVVSVQIDSELGHLHIRSAGRSLLNVNIVGKVNLFPHHVHAADFVQASAVMLTVLEKIALVGKGVLTRNIPGSSIHPNGCQHVTLYGNEIDEFASDAVKHITAKIPCTKSTTSVAGQNSPNYEQTLKILCCYVTNAISSFIPKEILSMSLFDLNIELVCGHTAIPTAADGPRYKSIGNSKAVPCVTWLGQRIARSL